MLAEGQSLHHVWRYVVLQLLDDYASDLRQEGVTVAATRFAQEPAHSTRKFHHVCIVVMRLLGSGSLRR